MKVLIIGGRSEHYEAALSLGLDVTGFANHIGVDSRIGSETAKRCEFVEIDIANIALCAYHAELLHRQAEFSGVFSFTEDGLETASLISKILNLPGSELAANAVTRNKHYTRRALIGTSLDNVRWTVARSTDEAVRFSEAVGFPLIVKQLNGSGSQNVRLVRTKADLVAVISELDLAEYLIEQFIDGPEFSVETISVLGQHYVLAITQKTTTENFVEMQHLIPAPLSADESAALEDAALVLLNRIELNTGVTHSEFKLRNSGQSHREPALIETQVRPGGGKVWKLVEISTGINMVKHLIASTLGLPVDVPVPTVKRTSLAYFPKYELGVVTRIEGLSALIDLPGVEYVDLELVVGKRTKSYTSSATRNGGIVISGASIEEAIERRDFALSTLHVDVAAE